MSKKHHNEPILFQGGSLNGLKLNVADLQEVSTIHGEKYVRTKAKKPSKEKEVFVLKR